MLADWNDFPAPVMSIRSLGSHCILVGSLLVPVAVPAFAADDAVMPIPAGAIALTPAEQDDFRTVRRFVLDGAQVADPRLRMLNGVSQAFFTEEELPAATRVSIDVLAEQARGSTDPFVLALLVDACDRDRARPKPTCSAIDIARQWTVADTQNQVAWLTLAGKLRAAGDEDGSRAAFLRGSQASVWHESYDDGARVVTAAIPKDLGPRARIALQYTGLTSSAAWLAPNTAMYELSTRCKDSRLRDACFRIIDTVDRDGGMLSRPLSNQIARREGADAGTVEQRARMSDALQHAQIDSGLKLHDEITDPAELARQAVLWDRRIALGEVAWSKALVDAGGPAERAAAEQYHRERTAAWARINAEEKQRIASRSVEGQP